MPRLEAAEALQCKRQAINFAHQASIVAMQGCNVRAWRGGTGLRRRFAHILACALSACLISACAVSEAHRAREREMLTRRIADDAVAYNQAYSAAINGQILLNILRAYNRQPRQYMSMTGFQNSVPDSRTVSLGVAGLPLGELGEQWGQGAFSVDTETQLEPDYAVEPFDSDDFSAIALRPTSTDVFRHFWDSGWNRDLLLILLVDQMEVSGASTTVYVNNAGTIAANCAGENYASGGCAFVRAARDFAQHTRSARRTPAPDAAAEACMPFAAYDVREVHPVRNPAGACPVIVVVGDTRYALQLRSLDAIIYYVGELIRRDAAHPPPEGVLEARLHVPAPGAPLETTPLFRVVEANATTEREYAATVTYAGRRYSAGAPANSFCFDPRGPEYCRGPAGDRSGTVLELLTALLAYNQSEAAVRAPQSSVLQTR
jgi:hypothetical protein